VAEITEDTSRTTRRSTRTPVLILTKVSLPKPAKKETFRKVSLETADVKQETPVEVNDHIDSESPIKEELLKTVGRRGRQKTINTVANKNTEEVELGEKPEPLEAAKKEPLKRGRRKTATVAPEETESAVDKNKSLFF